MRKEDELTKEHTCMQHAHPKEMVFVLLSRDAAAPVRSLGCNGTC